MIGDEHNQRQNQSAKQETNIHAAGPQVKVPCAYYTNAIIASLESRVEEHLKDGGFYAGLETMMGMLERARQIDVLQHMGRPTKVFCSLLDGENCQSSKNLGKRCYLLAPKQPLPAAAVISPRRLR